MIKFVALTVQDLFAVKIGALDSVEDVKPQKTNFGKLSGNTVVQFNKAVMSSLNLVGKARGYDQTLLQLPTTLNPQKYSQTLFY